MNNYISVNPPCLILPIYHFPNTCQKVHRLPFVGSPNQLFVTYLPTYLLSKQDPCVLYMGVDVVV